MAGGGAKQSERRSSSRENRSYETYRAYVEARQPEVVANNPICLINQAALEKRER